MSGRIILHCDLNNFFASVECLDRPDLKNKPVAVCGNVENRHGIILAKNEIAKKFGVRTPEPVWEAKLKCPDLILLEPHYDKYVEYSKMARDIYYEFTDMVEPFGIDECWLDVTGSKNLFGTGYEMAEQIKSQIKKQTGLTISVGVSFNKVFAKLGSDMKKPDAITEITEENFKEKIWNLPAGDLLGVGQSTKERLYNMGVITIGDIVRAGEKNLKICLGKSGETLFTYANGLDMTRVKFANEITPPKSIGRGVTTPKDLLCLKDINKVMLSLCEKVCSQLRVEKALAGTVQISLRDKNLAVTEHQRKLPQPTRFPLELTQIGMELVREIWNLKPVRSVSIRACNLIGENEGIQLTFEKNNDRLEQTEALEATIERLRQKYNRNIIRRARLMKEIKYTPTFLPTNPQTIIS